MPEHLFPAQAGVIPIGTIIAVGGDALPRAGGGDPTLGCPFVGTACSSPRRRG